MQTSLQLACAAAGDTVFAVGAEVILRDLKPPETDLVGVILHSRDRLEGIAGGREGIYGVAVLESVSGVRISLWGDEGFMAVSIGELRVLTALYREQSVKILMFLTRQPKLPKPKLAGKD